MMHVSVDVGLAVFYCRMFVRLILPCEKARGRRDVKDVGDERRGLESAKEDRVAFKYSL